jgi:kynurenine formamidase
MAAARYLAERGVTTAGTDTEDFEVMPSTQPHSALPVHLELLGQHGIHIMEMLYLEQLATPGTTRHHRRGELPFVCLPLRIRGATGSMVRTIAIT